MSSAVALVCALISNQALHYMYQKAPVSGRFLVFRRRLFGVWVFQRMTPNFAPIRYTPTMKFAAITTAALGLLVSLFWTPSVHAFGSFAHRVSAEIAEAELKPATKRQLAALLPFAPRANLVDLSTWADELRDTPNPTPELKQLAQTSARWHYMNLPRGGCNLPLAEVCPDGHCLAIKLQEQIRLLADKKLDPVQRAQALAFVVHMVGDMHQPLHLGFANDKGGNTVQISLPPALSDLRSQREGANLHALWDSYIYLDPLTRQPDAKSILALRKAPDLRRQARKYSVLQMTRESCEIVQAADFYPPSAKITQAYLQQMRPRARLRVVLAGLRLAHVLNTALAP